MYILPSSFLLRAINFKISGKIEFRIEVLQFEKNKNILVLSPSAVYISHLIAVEDLAAWLFIRGNTMLRSGLTLHVEQYSWVGVLKYC